MTKPTTASEMGRKGGKNRAKNLSKARMSEIAKLGAEARWKKLKTMTKID